MGLPGSGKTTLANELAKLIKSKRLNADEVRKAANDWDFSEEGRTRQAKRMADFAKKMKNEGDYVIADFICPTPEARSLFPADYIVWVDTIKSGRFDDTNKMIGYCKLRWDRTTEGFKNIQFIEERKYEGSLELERIYFLQKNTGKGYGSQFLKFIENYATQNKYHSIWRRSSKC